MKPYPVSKLLEVDTSARKQLSYNVLIVEDNLINQEVLRRQLRKEGCVTHVAGNGKEALRIIAQSGFVKDGGISIDIILMDMEMPVMDGNTATLKIREMERSGKVKKHVPIMGISANARPEQVAKMTEAGMVGLNLFFCLVCLVNWVAQCLYLGRCDIKTISDCRPFGEV